MKKIMILIIVLAVGGTVGAAPGQNGTIYAPEIGAIVCDGDLSDWAGASMASLPYVFWNGTGLPGTTTTVQFAWNDVADLLYVAVQTDEASVRAGGWAVIGSALDTTSSTVGDVKSTQLGFGPNSISSNVDIVNEIDWYGIRAEGTTGVQAGFSTTLGVTTYEIAIPFWADWTVMTDPNALSMDDVVNVYAVMQDDLGTGNGTNMTFNGNPAFAAGNWSEGAEVILSSISDVACLEAIGSGAGLVTDLNKDCFVNMEDFAIVAQNYLNCNDPENPACP